MKDPHMSEQPKRSFGALPPEEFAWQIGKTAATIKLVHAVESMDAETAKAYIITALKEGRIAAVTRPQETEL